MKNYSELSLKGAIDQANPLYMLPRDPVLDDVLIPALKNSLSLNMMFGYFTSGSFSEIAPGLATFLKNSDGILQLVICPVITEDDYNLIALNQNELANKAKQIIIDDIPNEDQISKHALECLAWLIYKERLIIKIALMKNGGMYHTKCWLFRDKHNSAALHGSSNATISGLTKNKEQLTLSRDWTGGEDAFSINQRLHQEFDNIWSLKDQSLLVFDLSEAVSENIIMKFKSDTMPNEEEYISLQNEIISRLDTPTDLDDSKIKLKIPDHLIYESGNFKHQGDAVSAWEDQNRRGVLEMATGSGKTITSMICATKLQDELEKGLLVVVSAPYKPLITQWCEEISDFGVQAVNLTLEDKLGRKREINKAKRRLLRGVSRVEILVTSIKTLCTEEFIDSIEKIKCKKLFIADECHNLGSESFISNPPEIFDFRLGLSATPIRQYDEEGTDKLFSYFGERCFSYSLDEAIGNCLTEYYYYPHIVELNKHEIEDWRDLTEKIRVLSFRQKDNDDNSAYENLLRQRRVILETAEEKISILDKLLDKELKGELKYTLIYTTDKKPEQMEQVNQLLKNKVIIHHQLTEKQTSNRKETEKILTKFQKGEYRILTAKRVLDEGVNIPQIKLAFILASTTVKRQWIQRRGRLLRKCEEIGKTHAIIHDFVVLPASYKNKTEFENIDSDAKKIVKAELERVWEFSRLAKNYYDSDGPSNIIEIMKDLTNDFGAN
jgi:superfamily II DNA or RNA helicase/HKD family nuclease